MKEPNRTRISLGEDRSSLIEWPKHTEDGVVEKRILPSFYGAASTTLLIVFIIGGFCSMTLPQKNPMAGEM
jgi:hypothetical protein